MKFKCLTTIVLILVPILNISYADQVNIPLALEFAGTAHKLTNKHTGSKAIVTSGLHFTFPVYDSNFIVSFGSEYGTLHKTNLTEETKILVTKISLRYPALHHQSHFQILPEISIANYALRLNPSGTINDAVIIAAWENDFGVSTGCTILFKYNWFIVSLPVSASAIFSSSTAYFFSGGLRCGIDLYTNRNMF